MCLARRRGPSTSSRTTDGNLDCAFVEKALLYVALKIGNWTDFWHAFFICDSEYSFETKVAAAAGPSIGSRKSYPAPPLPPGLSKLFRIAQLIIQYLLHSQKKLTEAISSLQASNDHLKQVRKKYYRLLKHPKCTI